MGRHVRVEDREGFRSRRIREVVAGWRSEKDNGRLTREGLWHRRGQHSSGQSESQSIGEGLILKDIHREREETGCRRRLRERAKTRQDGGVIKASIPTYELQGFGR